MSAAIFHHEIHTLERQVTALQAQIVAAQERIGKLAETETLANSWLEAGAVLKEKVSALAPEALSKITSSILNLFQGGNDGNGGNGNHPAPEPQPGDDGGCEMTPQPNDDGGAEVMEQSLNQTVEMVDEIAVQPEPLTGQSCEWASPWASPLASPLATPLCCQLSDTPQSALQGQSVEIACIVSDAPKKPEYIELVPVSREVHYQQRIHDGEIICCYVGFNNKTKAKQWGEFLAVHHSVAAGFELRNSERLTAFKYEIKLWGMSLKQIEKLAESDLQKSPPSNFGTFPVRKVEPVAPLPKPLQIDDVEIGDTVRSITVKHWSYLVLAKMENGMLDCERIGASHIRLAIHPGAVELVSKAIKVEPVAPIEGNVPATATATDWFAEAKELGLSLDNIAPGHYIAYHKYRKLGEVIEKHNADSPYYVNREQKTMLNVGKGDGQKYATPHEAAIGLAKFLKVIVEPEVAKTDLNGSYSEPFPAPQALQTWREIETEQQKQIDVVSPEEQIEANDWVELLVNGDRYQVAEVDNEGIHLVTDDGNMLVQPDEVTLLFRVPANWQPFQAPTNWQPF